MDRLTKDVSDAMRRAGISEMKIYAWEKTGILLTESNLHLISEEDLKEYNDVCDEWEAKQ